MLLLPLPLSARATKAGALVQPFNGKQELLFHQILMIATPYV
jgi:hypothetical protein